MNKKTEDYEEKAYDLQGIERKEMGFFSHVVMINLASIDATLFTPPPHGPFA